MIGECFLSAQQVGDLEILSNQLFGNDSVSLATYANTTEADVSVQMYVALTGTQAAGLIARYAGSGDQNMYLGQLAGDGTDFIATISKNIGGTWTDLATMTLPVTATGTLRFEVIDDVLRLYFNDKLILSAQDDDLTAAGLVGVRTNAGVSVDNFVAKISVRKGEAYHDWRNRTVATKAGVQASESNDTQRPISYVEYNNLGQVIASEYYDGDNVIIVDGNSDGVPDLPSSSLRRARSEMDYDDLGRVFESRTYSVDQSAGTLGGYLVSESWFDQRGNQIKQAGPGGLVSKMAYDGAGRTTKSFVTDGGGDTGWSDADDVTGDVVLDQVEYTYDDNGNVILTTARQRFHDETGTGDLGNATTGVLARVSYAASYYDLADRMTDSVSVGTNGGSAYSRPGTVPTRSDTELVFSSVYDAAGRVSITIDPRGIETRTEYDDLGRVIKTIQAYVDGTPSSADDRTTEYTYDGNGNLLTVKAWSSAGTYQITQYLYGVSVIDAGVNSNDLVHEIRHPDPSTGDPSTTTEREFYLYNGAGEVTSFTDRNGNVHVYAYDVLGRRLSDTVTYLASGVDGAIRRLETSYDTVGRAEKLTSYDAYMGGNIVNDVQRVYNGLGQLIEEFQEHSGAVNTGTSLSVQYAYSEMAGSANHSRLESMTYPNGRVITYDYGTANSLNDRISRLDAIIDGSTTLEAYEYLGLGIVVVRSHPEPQVDLTYVKLPAESTGDAGDQYTGLDRFGRVVDQRWIDTSTDTDLDRFFYTYDRNSNRTSKLNDLNSDFDETYEYDLLDQLVAFTRADGFYQDWTFDAQGNWTDFDNDGTSQTRTHNAQNEITGISGATTPTFDANGNMTTDATGRQLVYDAWNRLIHVKDSGGTPIISFQYDTYGWRVQQTTATEVRDFYFSDHWQVIEEQVTGNPAKQYVLSPLFVDAMIVRDWDSDNNGSLDTRNYVNQDANWNMTAVIDASGSIEERYAYTAFGDRSILDAGWGSLGASTVAWVHGHQGLRLEETIDLYDSRHRWYSSSLGRFASIDPASRIDTDNLYLYVRNAPQSLIDPYGLRSSDPCPKGDGWTLKEMPTDNPNDMAVYASQPRVATSPALPGASFPYRKDFFLWFEWIPIPNARRQQGNCGKSLSAEWSLYREDTITHTFTVGGEGRAKKDISINASYSYSSTKTEGIADTIQKVVDAEKCKEFMAIPMVEIVTKWYEDRGTPPPGTTFGGVWTKVDGTTYYTDNVGAAICERKCCENGK